MTTPDDLRLLENNPGFLPPPPAEIALGPNAVPPAPPVEPDPLDPDYLVTEDANGFLLVNSPGGIALGGFATMEQANERIALDLLDPIDVRTYVPTYVETGLREEIENPGPVTPDRGLPVVPADPFPIQPETP